MTDEFRSLSRSKFQAEAAPTPPNLRAWEPARLAKLDLLSLSCMMRNPYCVLGESVD